MKGYLLRPKNMESEIYERQKHKKPNEVANVHIQAIISLPTIYQLNVNKIQEFYEKFKFH